MSLRCLSERPLPILLLAAVVSAPFTESWADWFALPEPPAAFFRYEDIDFVDENHGRLVGFVSEFYRTSDGGTHWELVPDTPELYYRSVAFVSPQRGWIGTVDSSDPLLETSDGGSTWSIVQGLPPFVTGICGLWVVDGQTVVGSGEYDGPGAAFIRTTDAGATWTAVDLSGMAAGLVDCCFSSPSTGVVVGHLGDLNNHRTIILSTTDGGTTWIPRYTGSRIGDHGWKVAFPSPEVGYCAIDRNPDDEQHVLKTTDRGTTWTELTVTTDVRLQGVGFLNDTTGWVGGWPGYTSVTTDGGMTWQSDPWGENVNSIFVVSENLAYAAGKRAYRYVSPAMVDGGAALEGGALLEVLGNPLHSGTAIAYRVPAEGQVRLSIVTPSGSELLRAVDAWHAAGVYRTRWPGRDGGDRAFPSGTYLLRLVVGSRVDSRKVIVLR